TCALPIYIGDQHKIIGIRVGGHVDQTVVELLRDGRGFRNEVVLAEEHDRVFATRLVEFTEIDLVVVVVGVPRATATERRSKEDLSLAFGGGEFLLEINENFLGSSFAKEPVDPGKAGRDHRLSFDPEGFAVDITQMLRAADRI